MESNSNCLKRPSRLIAGLTALTAAIIAAPAIAGVPCSADLNGDGVVDSEDLGILLSEFGACQGTYEGPCAVPGFGLPGCSADPDCQAIVCAVDPTCCLTFWDSACANLAQQLCSPTTLICIADINGDGVVDTTDLGILLGDFGCTPDLFCGSQFAGSCCEANGTPFCDDTACCELICADDPFCCDTAWDDFCASIAIDNCMSCFTCGSAEAGSCCEANGTPFCNDAGCCEAVCAQDPFCCDNTWDNLCANAANAICPGCEVAPACGVIGTGSCCEANPTPFCNDAACCEAVCALDPFCCNTEWDNSCANDANNLCTVCGVTTACGVIRTGSCCESNGTPFCEDAACCELICAGDPFCCTNTWDSVCANAANNSCTVCGVTTACGSADAGSCCEANGTPFCEDAACCELVCAADPFCCTNTWDGICADAAIADCAVCAP